VLAIQRACSHPGRCYASAKVQIIFETTEDFEKKDKIIVLIGQLLRELARFVACGDDCRYKLEK
jgi:hypothetical protein